MESSYTVADFYEKKFNSRNYLETYYLNHFSQPAIDKLLSFALEKLVKTFSSGPKFRTLLEIGCGPCLHLSLCASEHVEEIVLSDFLSNNRQEIELWLKNDPGAFDWSPITKAVCELEGNRGKWAEKEKKLRDSIKQVVKCDVHQSNPLDPVELEPVDCVMTSYCLEVACKDKAAYHTTLRNVTSLLKPGGVLIMIGVLNETFYMINDQKFPCVTFDQAFLEQTLTEVGYEIEQLEIALNPNKSVDTLADFDASFFLVARKK
ncbi:nicotinamide N-methyltransferase [Mustelus asterias]